MMRPLQEHTRAISSLRTNHNFIKIIELLELEQSLVITGLMTAPAERVGALQGKAQLLEELLKLIRETK